VAASDGGARVPDPQQARARAALTAFVEQHPAQVFFSRQLEVLHEDTYFHWVTNRAVRELVEEGVLHHERRPLRTGGTIHLLWHRSYRFYRRSASRVVALVEAYAQPAITEALGLHGELMALEGFARCQFVLHGRDTRAYGGTQWQASEHTLDFIFARDGLLYGVEVKNALAYMDYEEFRIKRALCRALGLRPVFVVRMLPRSWIQELIADGGYGMILKYQLYPWTHRALARQVAQELGLPVDAPRALAEGTLTRFLRWHQRQR